jgi:predicted short-subunit dehydrogenase-like oxidoreductase (DUF2520 family)
LSHARIVGRGRAGSALALALEHAGWTVSVPGRGDDLASAASDTDALILAVPDAAIASVARSIEPWAPTLVVHLSGAVGLEALRPHGRRAGMHPLVALPSRDIGASRLVGAWFGVEGDEGVFDLVAALNGQVLRLGPGDRATYHAAAAIASNHLVALLGQVERLAANAGLPIGAFLDLARGTLDNVEGLGAAAALTGPVARRDWETVARHLDALPATERATYLALAAEAARLAGTGLPADLLGEPSGPQGGPFGSRTAEVAV